RSGQRGFPAQGHVPKEADHPHAHRPLGLMISAIAAKQQRDMAPVQSAAISRFILLSGPVHAPAQTRPGASGRLPVFPFRFTAQPARPARSAILRPGHEAKRNPAHRKDLHPSRAPDDSTMLYRAFLASSTTAANAAGS